MGQKRRRLATSCVQCRGQKLKCDRETPCSRCQKRGIAAQCKYVPYAEGESPGQSADEPTPSGTSPGYLLSRQREARDDARAVSGDTATIQQRDWRASRAARPGSPLSWEREAEDYAETASRDAAAALQRNWTGPRAGNSSLPAARNLFESNARRVPDHQVNERTTQTGSSEQHRRAVVFSSNTSFAQQHSHGPAPHRDHAILRGESFKTIYQGPSHPTSMLLDFDELSKLIKEVLERFKSSMDSPDRFQGNFKRIRKRLKQELSALSFEHEALLKALPDSGTLERLVNLYVSTFETTYRILHIPTFWAEWHRFREDPLGRDDQFLVILLLITAITICLEPQEQATFIGRVSTLRHKAIKCVTVCELWLRTQSYKNATLASFQIRTLLVLAKRINMIKRKRAWSDTGELLQIAMAAGLHREPTQMGQSSVSPFDQEMRRRLWATMIEFEILSAGDSGMPPSISHDGWDTRPPSDIHDEDFDSHSAHLPPESPPDEETRTSFLHLSNRHAHVRLALLNDLNRLKGTITTDMKDQYDASLRDSISTLDSIASRNQIAPALSLQTTLAKLQLYESLLLLHQRAALQRETSSGRFFSRSAARDAAAAILDVYRNIGSPQVYSSLKNPVTYALSFHRYDSFRAGLWLCLDICHSQSAFSEGSSVTFNREQAVELLDTATAMQRNKVNQLGEGYHNFWILSSALTLANSKCSPTAKSFEQIAIDATIKFAEISELVLNRQERLPHDGVTSGPAPESVTSPSCVQTSGATVAIPRADSGQSTNSASLANSVPRGLEDLSLDFNLSLDSTQFTWPEFWGFDSFYDEFAMY